jgi:hypothetical protein
MRWIWLLVLVGCSEARAPGVLGDMHCARTRRYGESHCFCVYDGVNRTAVTWAPMDMCLPPPAIGKD